MQQIKTIYRILIIQFSFNMSAKQQSVTHRGYILEVKLSNYCSNVRKVKLSSLGTQHTLTYADT